MRRARSLIFTAAGVALVAACTTLRAGPLTSDASASEAGSPRLDAHDEGDSALQADASLRPRPGYDREWAMWRVPPSSPPAGNYTVSGGLVLDETTRLEWMQAYAPAARTHAEAIAECAGVTLGGGGFRLPTRIELLSLVDYAVGGKGLNTAIFGTTPAGTEVWSLTPDALEAMTRAWFVRFANGESATAGRGEMKAVRCVRGPAS